MATAANHSVPIPGKLTPTVLEKICEGYEQGLSVDHACHAANVSSVSFHRYRRAHPEFEERWLAAEALNTCYLERRAYDLALTADNRSPTMLIFMLKARMPHKYRDGPTVQTNVQMNFAGTFAEAMSRFE